MSYRLNLHCLSRLLGQVDLYRLDPLSLIFDSSRFHHNPLSHAPYWQSVILIPVFTLHGSFGSRIVWSAWERSIDHLDLLGSSIPLVSSPSVKPSPSESVVLMPIATTCIGWNLTLVHLGRWLDHLVYSDHRIPVCILYYCPSKPSPSESVAC